MSRKLNRKRLYEKKTGGENEKKRRERKIKKKANQANYE